MDDDFDPRKKARRDDPDTSHEAAEEAAALARVHWGIITAALLLGEPDGMTVDDISDATGLEKHAVFRRMSELEDRRMAHTFGDKRKLRTNRPGRVWHWGPLPVTPPAPPVQPGLFDL